MARSGGAVRIPGVLDTGSPRGDPQRSRGTEGLLGETPTTAGRHRHPGAGEALQTNPHHSGGSGRH